MKSLMLIVLLSACDGGEPAAQTCDTMAAGLDRDQCFYDEIKAIPGAGIEDVLTRANLIQDRIVRQASVISWMKAHLNEIPRDRGQALCQMLDGQDQSYCMRQLSSPHLYEDRSPVTPNNPNNPPPPGR
ncbi:MAG: hypothetical protein ACI8RZ_003672 [Myxococcota bacterium]|jgi:hypothetical protein